MRKWRWVGGEWLRVGEEGKGADSLLHGRLKGVDFLHAGLVLLPGLLSGVGLLESREGMEFWDISVSEGDGNRTFFLSFSQKGEKMHMSGPFSAQSDHYSALNYCN